MVNIKGLKNILILFLDFLEFHHKIWAIPDKTAINEANQICAFE